VATAATPHSRRTEAGAAAAEPIPASAPAPIEVRYKNGTRWYPARVTRDHQNGTCDVEYDDGEVELRVAEDRIRPATR